MGGGADAFWGAGERSGVVVSWKACGGKRGVLWAGRETDRPGCGREHRVLAGDADRGQVSCSQGFGLCPRAVRWVWQFFCRRGTRSDLCWGRLPCSLVGGWLG